MTVDLKRNRAFFRGSKIGNKTVITTFEEILGLAGGVYVNAIIYVER